MDLQLKGKRALVTGGSRGIGLACARQLAREGCAVMLAARDPEALKAAAASIAEETGAKVLWCVVDTAAELLGGRPGHRLDRGVGGGVDHAPEHLRARFLGDGGRRGLQGFRVPRRQHHSAALPRQLPRTGEADAA